MIRKQSVKGKDEVKVTFVVPDTHPNLPASVVGDFNDWTPGADKLVKRSNGTYSTAVTLPADGRYRFRYYGEDGTWFNDEAADAYEMGEQGADNCIITT